MGIKAYGKIEQSSSKRIDHRKRISGEKTRDIGTLIGGNMKRQMLAVMILMTFLSACATPQTKTQQGAVYGAAGGAAAGAIIGQVLGRDTQSTLWGAAIGAAIGGVGGGSVGRMMDNQERELREALATSEAAAVRREGNLLALTFKGDVTFDTNSTVVKPGLLTEIDRVAQVFTQYPDTLIQVEGHTDSVGSENYNLELSYRRANSVRDLLVQRGVYMNRIETLGFGEIMPVATNDSAEGRQRNRRVEIKVAPKLNQ